jgi:CRP-like cAMP-binding protein
MEKHIIEAMERCPLFSGMTNAEIDLLMEHVAQCRVIYSKGQVVRSSGSPCMYADIIVKGELLARMAGKSNHEVEVCRLDSGHIISPAFIFADNHSMPVTVIATEKTEILRLEPDELSRLIDQYPVIRTNYIKVLSNIITFLTNKIKILALFSAKEKVEQLISNEYRTQHTDIIHLDKSRQELANSFGIQKNSLIRALNELVSEGAIKVKGREITILDKEKFQ